MYNTAWNIYAIFSGECYFSSRTPTFVLKILLAISMFYFFIMCSAYSGLLKGFLTLPQVSSPIETPQDVCIKFTIGDFSKYKANAKVVANTQLKVELNSFD